MLPGRLSGVAAGRSTSVNPSLSQAPPLCTPTANVRTAGRGRGYGQHPSTGDGRNSRTRVFTASWVRTLTVATRTWLWTASVNWRRSKRPCRGAPPLSRPPPWLSLRRDRAAAAPRGLRGAAKSRIGARACWHAANRSPRCDMM